MSLSRTAMLVCTICSWTLLTTVGGANAAPAPAIDAHAQQQAEEKRKSLMADATSAIRETQNALRSLDEGKKKAAVASLESATGKLELILAREPKLALAPASVHVVSIDLQAGVEDVKKVRIAAEELLREGRVQEARHVLAKLASETVISVSNIPLATYPAAIKEAARLVDQDKPEEAKRALQTALNTQVITDTIIPKPVVSAAESLKLAEGLAAKKDRTSDESKRLTADLAEARGKLEFAQALGYGTKGDFQQLYDQLTEIEQKTAGDKSETGLFAKIKSSLSKLLNPTPSVKS